MKAYRRTFLQRVLVLAEDVVSFIAAVIELAMDRTVKVIYGATEAIANALKSLGRKGQK